MKTERYRGSLLEWRTAAKMTQQEAAKFLGISQGRYSRWESSDAPKRTTAKRISAKTGVPLVRLLRIY